MKRVNVRHHVLVKSMEERQTLHMRTGSIGPSIYLFYLCPVGSEKQRLRGAGRRPRPRPWRGEERGRDEEGLACGLVGGIGWWRWQTKSWSGTLVFK
jgi:hypothetical protein